MSLSKILFIFFLLVAVTTVHASVIDDLQTNIDERSGEIEKLEQEIREYQEELEDIEREARSLSRELRRINLTGKKINADIRVTEQKIGSATSNIQKLELETENKGQRINQNANVLGELFRELNELESRTLVEIIFSNGSFSSFWSTIEQLDKFQDGVRSHLKNLKLLKADLEVKTQAIEDEKRNLLALKVRLIDQRQIIGINKQNKGRLLEETKNKESNYEKLLKERLEQRDALQREIAEFEARLRVEIDPDSLPEVGTGVLAWPLNNITLTQYFGNTPFASANPQVYSGQGHNGIDLRASPATAIKAAANGVVVDIGDTDKQCYKVSYGKWILIRHHTGLTTLYAHLSLVRVEAGQEVLSGEIIGYSGNSGYSTGPHLHFGVFATKAVHVTEEYKSRVCGTYLKLPLAAQNGYLNPLSYLPVQLQ